MPGAEDTILGSSVSQEGALGSCETTLSSLLVCVFTIVLAGCCFPLLLTPAWLLLTSPVLRFLLLPRPVGPKRHPEDRGSSLGVGNVVSMPDALASGRCLLCSDARGRPGGDLSVGLQCPVA